MCLSGGHGDDIAEQLAVQTAGRLRATNRVLAIAEELADFGQWRLEPDEQLIERSPRASAILGIGAGEPLSPAQAMARIHPADRFGLLRQMVRALRGEPEVGYQARLNGRPDEQCTIRIRAQGAPRDDGSGNILFGVIRDISPEVAREARLIAAFAATPRASRRPAFRPPTIDQCQLDDIRESLGPDKLNRLLELAQSELSERPGAIRRSAERQDFAQLRNEAHSFKGAVASFGLVAVALAARAVELAAPGAELELALGRLDSEAIRARIALAPLIRGQAVAVAANG